MTIVDNYAWLYFKCWGKKNPLIFLACLFKGFVKKWKKICEIPFFLSGSEFKIGYK